MDILKLHEAVQSLPADELEWLKLLSEGHSVQHAAVRFQRGVSVNRSGTLKNHEIPSSFLDKLESAGLMVETYQPRLGEPWKSILPISVRSYVRRALHSM